MKNLAMAPDLKIYQRKLNKQRAQRKKIINQAKLENVQFLSRAKLENSKSSYQDV